MKQKNKRGAALLLIALATLTVVAFSCKKEPVEVGLGIQPEEDQISVLFHDSASIHSHSVINDSVRTDETVLSLAGSYFDPVFGSSTAGFFTQYLLGSSDPDLGGATADSVILSLAYAGYYGKPGTPILFKVYQLESDLYEDSVYYSNQSRPESITEIWSATIEPQPEDSITIDSVDYAPHLRINLTEFNTDFGDFLINPDAYSTVEEFVEYTKGLFITAQPAVSEGSILYFNLSSDLSKMELFYTKDDSSYQYEYSLSGDCARYNYFMHDYDNADPSLQAQITGTDTSLGDQTLYLQSMQGINTNFKLPGLDSWNNNGKVAVTRAELVLPIINPSEDYPPPSKLLLGTYDDEGELVQLIDYQEGASFFGGTYDSTRSEYRFRITRHVQQILNEEQDNNELVLLVSGRSVQANRVVIGGPLHPSRAMRLETIYVPIQ